MNPCPFTKYVSIKGSRGMFPFLHRQEINLYDLKKNAGDIIWSATPVMQVHFWDIFLTLVNFYAYCGVIFLSLYLR